MELGIHLEFLEDSDHKRSNINQQMTSPFKIERNRFDDDQELCVIAQNYGQGVAKKGW